jgi:hypothetical protein
MHEANMMVMMVMIVRIDTLVLVWGSPRGHVESRVAEGIVDDQEVHLGVPQGRGRQHLGARSKVPRVQDAPEFTCEVGRLSIEGHRRRGGGVSIAIL